MWWSKKWWTSWWFQIFFIFPPTWGNDPIWLYNIFQMGWNHQLVNESGKLSKHLPAECCPNCPHELDTLPGKFWQQEAPETKMYIYRPKKKGLSSNHHVWAMLVCSVWGCMGWWFYVGDRCPMSIYPLFLLIVNNHMMHPMHSMHSPNICIFIYIYIYIHMQLAMLDPIEFETSCG